MALYSTLVEDLDTTTCFLLFQKKKRIPQNDAKPYGRLTISGITIPICIRKNQQLPNSNSECKQNSTWIRLESKYSKLK